MLRTPPTLAILPLVPGILLAAAAIQGCGTTHDAVADNSASDLTAAGAADAGSAASRPIDPRVVLKGQEWGRCWFDAHPTDDGVDLVCKKTVDPRYPYPLGDVRLAPRSNSGSFLGGSGSMGPIHDNIAEVRGKLTRNDFPLQLDADVTFSEFTGSNFDVFLAPSNDLTSSIRVLGPGASESQPLVFTQPFDLWPIRIVILGPLGYELKAAPYPFSVAPFKTENAAKTSELTASVRDLMQFDGSHTIYLPVPRDGKIAATVATRQAGTGVTGAFQPFVFDGPGVFVAEDTGLRRATTDEIAQLLPDLPPTPQP